VATDERIRAMVRTHWRRVPDRCTPALVGTLPVWRLTVDGQRYVATEVPDDLRHSFLVGLAVAEHLSAAGLSVSRPVRAADGGLCVSFGEGVLTLQCEVLGRPLSADDPLDQQWWGDLLGAAHRRLADFAHPHLDRLSWLRPEAGHLSVADWVRPVVARAVAGVTRLTVTDQLTYGVLHGDPAPYMFRLDARTGRTGVAHWPAAATGPLVYDIAAAVAHAGGVRAAGELLDGYRAAGSMPADELDAALPVMVRYRLAEPVDRFARRLAAGQDDAWVGLRAAREALATLDDGA
jgi:Ser/Thr protein kinase RdoA (MazF antagonist)